MTPLDDIMIYGYQAYVCVRMTNRRNWEIAYFFFDTLGM